MKKTEDQKKICCPAVSAKKTTEGPPQTANNMYNAWPEIALNQTVGGKLKR